MTSGEAVCATCGRKVRVWGTSTGWKHVRNWRMSGQPCPDSPPRNVRPVS